jgi:hypothetical protein
MRTYDHRRSPTTSKVDAAKSRTEPSPASTLIPTETTGRSLNNSGIRRKEIDPSALRIRAVAKLWEAVSAEQVAKPRDG